MGDHYSESIKQINDGYDKKKIRNLYITLF